MYATVPKVVPGLVRSFSRAAVSTSEPKARLSDPASFAGMS
jgi:hypothetical protein